MSWIVLFRNSFQLFRGLAPAGAAMKKRFSFVWNSCFVCLCVCFPFISFALCVRANREMLSAQSRRHRHFVGRLWWGGEVVRLCFESWNRSFFFLLTSLRSCCELEFHVTCSPPFRFFPFLFCWLKNAKFRRFVRVSVEFICFAQWIIQ